MLKSATTKPHAPLAFASLRRLSARLSRLSERVLPPSTAMHLIAHHERQWGEPELRLLPHLVPRDQIAVDVGAAEGVYTYFLAGSAPECHAFEANPESASAIRHRIPRARVHGCALSDRQGELELRIPVVAGIPYRGWATTQPTNRFSALPDHEILAVQVPCATLDSFGLEGVGFMKIDVEGHELEVLTGAIETLKSSRPNLLIEAEDRHRPGAVRLVRDFLGAFGYRGWFLEGGVLRPLEDRFEETSDRTAVAHHYVNNYVFISGGRYAADEKLRALCRSPK